MGRARTGVIALLTGVVLLGGCTTVAGMSGGDRTDSPASARSLNPQGYPLPQGERIAINRLPGDQTRLTARVGDVLVVTRSEFPTDSNAVLVLAAVTGNRLSYQAIAPGTTDLVVDKLPPAPACADDSVPCAGRPAPPTMTISIIAD